jgi:transcriptional regulator with PAS, ATPase and Fis domain
MIERAIILADDNGALDLCHLLTAGEEIDSASFVLRRNGNIVLAPDVAAEGADLPSPESARAGLEETEAAMLRAAVAESNGNLSKAARLLGITRPKLAYRLRKYEIHIE